jgi:TRAP transporter TAXI family solute receptor
MKVNKTILITVALFLLLGFGAYANGSGQHLRMATGGSSGTYYTYGSEVGPILTKKTGIPFTMQSTGASKANIQLIAAGEAEIAIVQNDVMDYAYKGTEFFSGEQSQEFAAMAGLYTEVCQIVANPAAGIRAIADLKGKIVSVGDIGSGTEFNARQILEAYGITFNDIDKQNLGFGASADALRNNTIDAFFCVAGAPTAAIVALSIEKDIRILEIDDDHAAALIRDYPFYIQFPIAGGSYRGLTSRIKTVAVKAAFIVSKHLSKDIVYRMTRALLESREEIRNIHIKGAELTSEYAVRGISIPFHPGAEQYFREIGVIR